MILETLLESTLLPLRTAIISCCSGSKWLSTIVNKLEAVIWTVRFLVVSSSIITRSDRHTECRYVVSADGGQSLRTVEPCWMMNAPIVAAYFCDVAGMATGWEYHETTFRLLDIILRKNQFVKDGPRCETIARKWIIKSLKNVCGSSIRSGRRAIPRR